MSKLKINLEASVASEKRVVPDKAYNNLTILGIESIIVDSSVSTDSKAEYDFHGMTVPKLIIKFKQFHSDGVPRYLTYVMTPAVKTKNDGTPMETETIENIMFAQYQKVRHIFDAFKAKHKIALPDLNVNQKTKEAYLEAVGKWYNAMVNWFVVDGTPIYMNGEKEVKLLFKLILNNNAKVVNIPDYINDGFCELLKLDPQGKPITALVIKSNERVEFTPATPNTNAPMMQPGISAASVNVNDL